MFLMEQFHVTPLANLICKSIKNYKNQILLVKYIFVSFPSCNVAYFILSCMHLIFAVWFLVFQIFTKIQKLFFSFSSLSVYHRNVVTPTCMHLRHKHELKISTFVSLRNIFSSLFAG
jgi:hypothetical protein